MSLGQAIVIALSTQASAGHAVVCHLLICHVWATCTTWFLKAKDPVQEAAALRIAEQYVAAFGQIAKEGNTVLLPAALSDPAAIVGQALGIYKGITGVGAPGNPAG